VREKESDTYQCLFENISTSTLVLCGSDYSLFGTMEFPTIDANSIITNDFFIKISIASLIISKPKIDNDI
jgi:hypothetical protein